MTQAFNPFFPQTQPANVHAPSAPIVQQPQYHAPPMPTQHVQAPAPLAPQPQPQQRIIPQGLSDASENDGFSTQFFRHLDGDWDLKIVGYVGARTPMLGIAVHITFEVLKSSTPDVIQVGSTWRIAYKYDYERQCKADKDTYGADATSLSRFLKALFAGYDLSARGVIEQAEHSLHARDWATQPGFVHLNGQLGKEKVKISPTGGQEKRRFRNDYWSAFKAA